MAKSKKTVDETKAVKQPDNYDPFASIGAASRFNAKHIVVWPWLAAIFLLVWILVIFLMAPSFSHEYTRFMSIRYQTKNPQKAIVYLEKLHNEALEKEKEQAKYARETFNPKTKANPTFCLELGNVYAGLKEWDKAMNWYQKAQDCRANTTIDDSGKQRDPYDFSSLLGLASYNLGKIDQAEQYFKQALEYDKNDYRAIYHLGRIAMDKNNYKEAIDRFKVVAGLPGYKQQVLDRYKEISERVFSAGDLSTSSTVTAAIQSPLPQ